MINIRVVQHGQPDVVKKVRAPRAHPKPPSVAEVLEGLGIRGEMVTADGVTLLKADIMEPGEYSLTVQQQPEGQLQEDEETQRLIHEVYKAVVVASQTVAFSQISAENFQKIKAFCGLTLRPTEEPPLTPAAKHIDAFAWDDRPEPSQSDRYVSHLAEIFEINGRSRAWVDCRRHPKMLSIHGVHLIGLNLFGTTDMAVVTRQAKLMGMPQEGLVMVFELKRKPLEARNIYQARVSLLAANIHSADFKPFMVLTDLNATWLLMWLDGLTLYTHMFESRGLAAGVVQRLIDGLPTSTDEPESVETAKLIKRRRLDLTQSRGRPDSSEDVARLGDLDDLLPHDEVIDMRLHQAMTLLKQCPVAPSWGVDLDKPPKMYV